jgi:hypothetical protein
MRKSVIFTLSAVLIALSVSSCTSLSGIGKADYAERTIPGKNIPHLKQRAMCDAYN